MAAIQDTFSGKSCTIGNDGNQELLPSLSAMFDGEATKQDIECLLSEDSSEISKQLESFHLIRQVLHKDEQVDVGLEDSLLLRIRAQLDDEDSLDTQAEELSNNLLPFVTPQEKKSSGFSWRVMLSGVAVAASVAFVIVLGGSPLLESGASNANLVTEVRSPVENRVITPLAELDKDSLQVDNVRLQHYLRQHAEQAAMTVGQGMMPMARVVSYPIKE